MPCRHVATYSARSTQFSQGQGCRWLYAVPDREGLPASNATLPLCRFLFLLVFSGASYLRIPQTHRGMRWGSSAFEFEVKSPSQRKVRVRAPVRDITGALLLRCCLACSAFWVTEGQMPSCGKSTIALNLLSVFFTRAGYNSRNDLDQQKTSPPLSGLISTS
jgi:hypothetical protein